MGEQTCEVEVNREKPEVLFEKCCSATLWGRPESPILIVLNWTTEKTGPSVIREAENDFECGKKMCCCRG